MNKKLIISTLLAGITALAFPLNAMAQASGTFVQGFVYDATNSNAPVSGANVNVTCNSTTIPATTNGAGKYAVTFTEAQCDNGDAVSVTASDGSLQGNNTGTAGEVVTNINVAVVNVFISQVPEFGLMTGAAAFLTSGGAFFAFRRFKKI